MSPFKIYPFYTSLLFIFLVSCSTTVKNVQSTSPPTHKNILVSKKPLLGLNLFEGWTDAQALGGFINTPGWEDSPFISPDGKTLYFGYTPLDVDEVWNDNPVVVGPIKAPKRTNHNGLIFDIYEAHVEKGKWVVENSSVNSKSPDHGEAAVGVGTNQSQMVFVRWPGEDIYLSTRQTDGSWGKSHRLPDPVNSPCNEDNPHLSKDGKTLYFDSNRKDLKGSQCLGQEARFQRHIWVSYSINQKWSEPQKLHIEAKKGYFFMQPFSQNDGQDLYWTGMCETSNSLCVYHSRRASKRRYTGTTMILQASAKKGGGRIHEVGEVSITEDGSLMYFVYQVKNGPSNFDNGIGFVHKKGK